MTAPCPVSLSAAPVGYADWLAELQTNLPSIERIESELGGFAE